MKKKLIIALFVAAIVLAEFTFIRWAEAKHREGAEICRVFRELRHARTVIFLDEIDVQDCPADFQNAYATYVLEVRSAGPYMSSKKLALSKLQDAARLHGVTFTREARS